MELDEFVNSIHSRFLNPLEVEHLGMQMFFLKSCEDNEDLHDAINTYKVEFI